MNNIYYNTGLYETLMNNINLAIYDSINEAYDNALLEKYNFKDFMDKAIEASQKMMSMIKKSGVDEKTIKAYKFIKKFVALSIAEIQKTKGAQAVNAYVNKLKAQFIEDLKNHNLTPKQMWKRVKILTIALIGAASIGAIYVQSSREAGIESTQNINMSDTQGSEIDDIINDEEIVNNNVLDTIKPYDYYVQYGTQMQASDTCIEYIKHKEVLCLYPYYTNQREQNLRKITIGYGHVIYQRNLNGKLVFIWPWADNEGPISMERRHEIEQQILHYQRKGMIKQSLCGTVDGRLQNLKRAKGMPNIITEKEAELLLKGDLQVADKRVKRFLSLNDKNDNSINKNVAAYCYYNQNIYDMLISGAYNMGNIKKNTEFYRSLTRCRYDFENNIINQNDFNVTFKHFCNLPSSKRRTDEYKAFKVYSSTDTLNDFKDMI